MATNRFAPACVAALLAASTVPATAFNTLFMRDSAMSAMSDAEFEDMTQAFYRALDEGKTVNWGDAGAAHGTITPLEPFTYSGYDCRKARYENFAGGVRGAGDVDFCKDTEGKWKLLSVPR